MYSRRGEAPGTGVQVSYGACTGRRNFHGSFVTSGCEGNASICNVVYCKNLLQEICSRRLVEVGVAAFWHACFLAAEQCKNGCWRSRNRSDAGGFWDGV